MKNNYSYPFLLHGEQNLRNPRVRFAPSPTGLLHVGGARTALITWLYAKLHRGTVLLRIDDTDKKRSKSEYTNLIREDLTWLGISYDEEVQQSSRFSLYQGIITNLISSGYLYPCYETNHELKLYRDYKKNQREAFLYKNFKYSFGVGKSINLPHWRFRVKNKDVTWNDMIYGTISFHGSKLSDPILVRTDGSPLFILAGIVDDINDGITHIIRGEDHLSNTALQIQLMEVLGSPGIIFAHLPLVRGNIGERLAKRSSSISLRSLRKDGYDPLSLSIYLSRLGISCETSLVSSMEELVRNFDLSRISRSSPKFSLKELEKLNKDLLQYLSLDMINHRLRNSSISEIRIDFWNRIRHNVNKIEDIEYFLKICVGKIIPILRDRRTLLQTSRDLPYPPWRNETWETWTQTSEKRINFHKGNLYMTIRLALTGKSKGPEMKSLLQVIGYHRSTLRFRILLDLFEID